MTPKRLEGAGCRWGSDERSYVPWGVLSCELLPIVSVTRDRSLAHFATLEKNARKPWQKQEWCMPPEHDAACVCHMEDI